MSEINIIVSNLLTPDNLYGELYQRVQLKHVFPDTKTSVDCVPKIPAEEIVKLYHEKKNLSDFDLSKFVDEYFNLPDSPAKSLSSDVKVSTVDHINRLWNIESRPQLINQHKEVLVFFFLFLMLYLLKDFEKYFIGIHILQY
jgi:neutral trehalase